MKPFATIRVAVSSSTTTASSAPAAHISTFGLKVVPLVPFRLALHRRFPSPLPKPVYVSYHLNTGHPCSLYSQAEHLRSSPELENFRLLGVVYFSFRCFVNGSFAISLRIPTWHVYLIAAFLHFRSTPSPLGDSTGAWFDKCS